MQERERFTGLSRIERKKCDFYPQRSEDGKVIPQGPAAFVHLNHSLGECLKGGTGWRGPYAPIREVRAVSTTIGGWHTE